jgi:hypothetical protein
MRDDIEWRWPGDRHCLKRKRQVLSGDGQPRGNGETWTGRAHNRFMAAVAPAGRAAGGGGSHANCPDESLFTILKDVTPHRNMSAEGSIAANVALFRPFIKTTVDKMVRTLFADDDDDDNEPNPTLGVLTGAEQVLTMLLRN